MLHTYTLINLFLFAATPWRVKQARLAAKKLRDNGRSRSPLPARKLLPMGDCRGVVFHCPSHCLNWFVKDIGRRSKNGSTFKAVDNPDDGFIVAAYETKTTGAAYAGTVQASPLAGRSAGFVDRQALLEATADASSSRRSFVFSDPEPYSPECVFVMACGVGCLPVVRALFDDAELLAKHGRFMGSHGLEVACRFGHVPIVRELLAYEPPDGEKPVLARPAPVLAHPEIQKGFWAACEAGYHDIVAELLTLTGRKAIGMAFENDRGVSGFILACEGGHLELVRLLLGVEGEEEVDVHAGDECAFRVACSHGHIALLRELLALTGERRVDVLAGHGSDLGCGFEFACCHGQLGIVRELLAQESDRRPSQSVVQAGFYAACAFDQLAIARELLALEGGQAVNVGADNNKCFKRACLDGHLSVVRLLLDLSGSRSVDLGDDWGFLQEAFTAGHTSVVREVLASDTGNGVKPVVLQNCIGIACSQGHAGALPVLMAAATRRDVSTDPKQLMLQACKGGHYEVLDALVELFGAPDVDTHDSLMWAMAGSERHSTRLLRRLMACVPTHPKTDFDELFSDTCGQCTAVFARAWLSLTGPHSIDVHGDTSYPLEAAFRQSNFGVCLMLLRQANFPIARLLPELLNGQEYLWDAFVDDDSCAYGMLDVLVSSEPLPVSAHIPQQVLRYFVAMALRQNAKPDDTWVILARVAAALCALPAAGFEKLAAFMFRPIFAASFRDHGGVFIFETKPYIGKYMWRGLQIDPHPIAGKRPHPGLRSALRRHGRREALLHRYERQRASGRGLRQVRPSPTQLSDLEYALMMDMLY